MRRFPQFETRENGDRDDGDESQPLLGMDSVGDDITILPLVLVKAIVVVMKAILSHLWSVLEGKFRA